MHLDKTSHKKIEQHLENPQMELFKIEMGKQKEELPVMEEVILWKIREGATTWSKCLLKYRIEGTAQCIQAKINFNLMEEQA